MVTEVAMTGRETPQARPRACLETHKHIGHVLVFAEQWQVEDDLQGSGVCGHHDETRRYHGSAFLEWLVEERASRG
ncbi:hypothetical protein J4Q44_G00178370 [Coregonus suidteri]|uniref:Uncharacterized protein n=1 Tax=Coregonus suidteri TaxID=861788 RepID=A0AAN8LJQ8_9TELE